MKTKSIVSLIVLSGFVFAPWSALAGGPGLLKLPVEGLTSQNRAECEQMLQTKLAGQLYPGDTWKLGRALASEDDGRHILLNPKPGILSLAEIEKALAGSPYKIAREQLLFRGVLRIQVSKELDTKSLRAALAEDGSGIDVSGKALKDGSHSFVLNSSRGESVPLVSYRDLMAFLKRSDAKLVSISWGVESEKDEDEYGKWVCRTPFGASILKEQTKAAVSRK